MVKTACLFKQAVLSIDDLIYFIWLPITPPKAAPPKVEPVSPPRILPATPPTTTPAAVWRCAGVMSAHADRVEAKAAKKTNFVIFDFMINLSKRVLLKRAENT